MAARSGFWCKEFSNFWIEEDGSFVEREFQVAKHDGRRINQLVIARAKTPRRAKELGMELPLTDDELRAWDSRKVSVMLSLVDRKVSDWPDIADKLVNTERKVIVEKNRHHDNFWGDCTCINCYQIGNNALGEIYMLIRRRLFEGRLIYDEHDMHTIEALSAPLLRRRSTD